MGDRRGPVRVAVSEELAPGKVEAVSQIVALTPTLLLQREAPPTERARRIVVWAPPALLTRLAVRRGDVVPEVAESVRTDEFARAIAA